MTFVRNFDGAQVFYVDSSTVDGASTCDISSVNLYFKSKPDLLLNLNDYTTGAYVCVVPTRYGVPFITRDSSLFTGHIAEVGYNDILTSSDATVPTKFTFTRPMSVTTDTEYALLFAFDASAQYVLWKSKVNEILTGSTDISPGPSNKFIGRFFTINTLFVADTTTDLDEYLKNWRPLADTSIKFDINIARYAHNGIPVSGNTSLPVDEVRNTKPRTSITANNTSSNTGFNINFNSYEYITYDFDKSSEKLFIGGQMLYANTVHYPGGWNNGSDHITITTNQGNNIIVANTLLPNGSTFAWSDIYSVENQENAIVITDGTKTNIRKIRSIQSNTQMTLDEGITFSNTSAKFMVTPVGRAHYFDRSSPFGVRTSMITLANSTANSTVRFTNNQITSVTITGGGSGYSNSDVLHIKGFENVADKVTGGYVATANIVTDGAGAITAVYFSNTGCGFVNTNAIEAVVANSTQTTNTTSNTSAGSSATFSYFTGSVIKTAYGNNEFYDCEIRNLDMAEFLPFFKIDGGGTEVDYKLRLEANYIKKDASDTLSGEAFFVNDGTSNNQFDIIAYEKTSTSFNDEINAIMSKSNEFVTVYEDGSPNDKVSANQTNITSESLKMLVDVDYVNTDWNTLRMFEPTITFTKYIINNDATNEHTDFGNAFAKGISKNIKLTRTAEDIRLFITAYKPAETDIKVYARIFKNEDADAFDDKNWTELEIKEGGSLRSSVSDLNDFVQLEYGFFQVPPDRTVLDGTVTLTSGSTTVEGSGTDFVTDLATGDLVYLYQPLFPENHMVVSVSSVTDADTIEIDTSTTNTSILAEGMNIEKIDYPLQAFNNKQNDNIVRYYNSNQSKFDGYETMAIKIVMLSSNPQRIPRIDDVSGAAVSA